MKVESTNDRIAVSGLGVVSCHGSTLDEQRAAFAAGQCKLTEVDRSAGYHRSSGSRFASLVDQSCYRDVLPPIKARRMSPPSRFAMVAAKRALEDASLEADAFASEHGPQSTAVVLGTSYGPSSYTERILRQIMLESPQAASPMLFTESVANAPAAQIALAFGCKGPNVTVTQREASALMAVAEGAWLVRSGRAERALVGGVEEVNPLLHSILDRFGALAGSRRRGGSGSEQALPFDAKRCGFNAGEGSAVLVLERESAVRDRGGRVRALLGPCARAFDPRAPATGWSEDASIAFNRLAKEWGRQGWDLSKISGVASGANGSPSGDALEARMLHGVSERANGELSVVAPKQVFGEQGMATLVGALLLMEGSALAPAAPFQAPSELPFQLDSGPWAHGQYLLSSLAAGGSFCWLGLESG